MKNLLQSLLLVVFVISITSGISVESKNGTKSGRIKVYIVNKCSSNVNFRVVSPGSTSDYTAYDLSTKPMSFMEGTKIYNSDGKLVHAVNRDSEGKEVVVCE